MDTTSADDLQLLRETVKNIAKLAGAIDDIAAQLHETARDVTIHVKYDDSITRPLQSIADTLSRLERQ
jgi:nitrate/nitrite-specific signal transduction histidine kinase